MTLARRPGTGPLQRQPVMLAEPAASTRRKIPALRLSGARPPPVPPPYARLPVLLPPCV